MSNPEVTTLRNHPGWILFFLVTGGLPLAFLSDLEKNIQMAATAACLVAIMSVWVLSQVYPARWISLGSSFAALFGVFHMGLLPPLIINAPLQSASDPAESIWINTPGFHTAIVLVTVAQSMFTAGYLLRARFASRVGPPAVSVAMDHEEMSKTDGPGIIGIIMLMLGIALWVYNAISSGASVFGSSYPEFLALTKNTDMPSAYILMGFGLVLVASSSHAVLRHRALWVFVLWSIPAFILGLRGEVIIPSAAYLVVAARRRHIGLRPWLVVASIAALAAGSAIRVLRDLSSRGGALNASIFNPFDSLVELGSSIRPLTTMINYHIQNGEPFVGMDTYLAPFRRVIVGRILGGPTVSVEADPSVFSTMILHRVGPIGGSPAAEAYRSGGILVMVIIMVLIGLAVASLDALPNDRYSNCLVGMLAFIGLFWVRNDFTPVPTEIVTAFVIILCIWMLEQWTGNRVKFDASPKNRSHPT